MALLRETLPDAHVWWRIADPAWTNPLDPSFAQRRGGRWNPPGSFPTLYPSEDAGTSFAGMTDFRWLVPGFPSTRDPKLSFVRNQENGSTLCDDASHSGGGKA